MAHDIVIRGGTIVDGALNKAFTGDLAISGDTITDMGSVSGQSTREINADGALVTPGFIDLHTHTWMPRSVGTLNLRQPLGTGSRAS